MATCIYCETNEADSREHWLPQWLGAFRDADVLRDRLCGACNNRLGELDHEMARTGLEAVDRYRLRLGDSGTDWEASNPFKFRTQRAEPPTVALARFSDEDHDLLMEDIPGSDQRRPLQQIVVRDAQGNGHPVRLPTNCTAGWLREALRLRSLEGCRLAEIMCERAEGPDQRQLPAWARRVLNDVFPATNIEFSLSEGGPEVLNSPLQMGLRLHYFRGLAKLGFHYLLNQCSYVDGNDPAFAAIRSFIRDGQGTVQDIMEVNAPSFLVHDPDRAFEEDGHFFFLEMDGHQVTVWIRLFVGSLYRRGAVRISVGPAPPVLVPTFRAGHFLRIYSDRPRDGFDGEMVSLPAIELDGHWRLVMPQS